MPEVIRFAQINAAGDGPTIVTSPRTEPGEGQVRVRMHAAALNFADLLIAKGQYQEARAFPFVPGLEGAGEVEAVGPGTSIQPGTRVSIWAGGTLSESAIFAESAVIPMPDTMSFEEGAGFQIAYGTSHLALTARAGLRAGETLAVLGAAGGVGLTAVEIGSALGAKVIAVARGAEKLEAARAAGAEILVDSSETADLKAALKELGGVDVVYDPVGDAPGLAAFGALRPGGRFLVIGFAGGKPSQLPLNHALVKNITVHGFYWGGYKHLDPQALRRSMEELFALYSDGKLHPHVGAILPLEQLAEGYELLRSRRSMGKVIITL